MKNAEKIAFVYEDPCAPDEIFAGGGEVTSPMRCFHGCTEIFIFTRGGAVVTFGKDKPVEIIEGYAIAALPYETHAIVPTEGAARYLRLIIGPGLMRDFERYYPGRRIAHILPPSVQVSAIAELIGYASKRMEKGEGTISPLEHIAIADLAISKAVELSGNEQCRPKIAKVSLADVMTYINDNCAEPISQVSVAAALDCSVPTLSSLIGNYLGIDFRTLVGDVRARKLHRLLQRPTSNHTPLKELAASCGLVGATGYRCYKRCYGVSPRQSRKD